MKKYLLLAFIIFNSIFLRAQDCPTINGEIKGSSPTYPAICEATATANPAVLNIFSGETMAVGLKGSKPGTTFSWTVIQTGVTGGSPGNGASIVQTLTNIGDASGTAVYTVTPKLGTCSGTSITIMVTVTPLFKNVVASRTFTKNNCSAGGVGDNVTYTVVAGTYSASTQETADLLAQNDINENGQNYANTNGSCTFYNNAVSGTFTKNNCGPGGIGTAETYIVNAGTYSAETQAQADAIAQGVVNANGQDYANTHGLCTFYNNAVSGSFTKNDCGPGGYGSTVTYTVGAGQYTASSQSGADAIAQSVVNTNGQAYANANGSCTFYNNAASGNFTKNDCGPGGYGSMVTYAVGAGQYTASSQAGADAIAQSVVNANGQAYANANGSCTFYNNAASGNFTKNDCGPGGYGSMVTYTVGAGQYTASSQAGADAIAQSVVNANGQAYANANGSCTFYNNAISGTFTRNNCGTGGTGTAVTYTVNAGTYTAGTQAQADAIAQSVVNANGQAYANANGTCSYLFGNNVKSGNFTRNNCGLNGTGSIVTYTVPAGTKFASTQAAADALAQNDVNANGQNYANTYGTCTACCATLTTSRYKSDGAPPEDEGFGESGYVTYWTNAAHTTSATRELVGGRNHFGKLTPASCVAISHYGIDHIENVSSCN